MCHCHAEHREASNAHYDSKGLFATLRMTVLLIGH